MRVIGSAQATELIDQTIIVGQRRHVLELDSAETVHDLQRAVRVPGVEKACEEDVARARVGYALGVGGNGACEPLMGLGEAAGVTKSVDHAR